MNSTVRSSADKRKEAEAEFNSANAAAQAADNFLPDSKPEMQPLPDVHAIQAAAHQNLAEVQTAEQQSAMMASDAKHLLVTGAEERHTMPGHPVKIEMLQPESVFDLPDEVKRNIVGYDDLELDEMLTRILGCFTAPVTCDRIIQVLWQKYKRTTDRAKVIARLRLLSSNGQIKKVEGSRSTYQSNSPAKEQ